MSGPDFAALPRRKWMENGVARVEVGIPGEERRGVLSPEALAAMKRGPQLAESLLEQALRAGDYTALRALPPSDSDLTDVEIEEIHLTAKGIQGKIPVICYRTVDGASLRSALVYFHGGGFRMGSCCSIANSMRLLAQYSEAVIFSVEYRLAPEHPFPCATDDAWSALRWVFRNAAKLSVDPGRIFVGGDSAGGNLAAACARRDRNMRTRILRGQLLIYPVLSQSVQNLPGCHFSMRDYEICEEQKKWVQSAICSLKTIMENFRLYTKTPEENLLPDASPLLDRDFYGLPPTWIFCAEFDYLTHQAKAYAQQLAAAGVFVQLEVYRGMHHGFMNKLGRVYGKLEIQ